MSQKTFIFIGRSGCGKGTQAKLLSEYLKKTDPTHSVLYIQCGAEFRDFIQGPSKTQELSRAIDTVGGLQPEFLAVYMWINVLIKKYQGNEHLILDGMPRRYHEAGVLDSIFKFYGIVKPFVFCIDISKEEATKRLLARKGQRVDDGKDGIEKRLSWFETDVLPAIDFYQRNHHYNFLQVDGMRSVEAIFKDIQAYIESHE